MAEVLSFIEMPRSADDPPIIEEAARLFLREVGKISEPHEQTLDRQVSMMDDTSGILAVDGARVLAGGRYGLERVDGVLTADLRDLAVIAEYQRTGRGIGKELIDLLERNAKADGAERMTVYSLWGAAGFYRKLGYRLVGEMEFAKTF